MIIFQQILFLSLFIVAIMLFSKRMRAIQRNILLGQAVDISEKKRQRWKNVLLLALGQRKMFKNPLVGTLHIFMFAGFLIINIEVLEIIIDGLTGKHRSLAPVMSAAYPYLINGFEFLAVLVIVVCIIFLARRNLILVLRFRNKELVGWPRQDANIILVAEIILMLLFLNMNGADTLLQLRGQEGYTESGTGIFLFSSLLHPMLDSYKNSSLELMERTCWWAHIIGIFAFLNYLPWSKHLHILLAFPNAYFYKQGNKAQMTNMKSIQNEVLRTFHPELIISETESTGVFGANDAADLGWKNLLDAYSCTECGRCTAVCPASMTGKMLSPRKIMMDTRDRIEEIGSLIDKNQNWEDNGKSLLFNRITEEELRACTTCNACVEACPVSINPLDIILQLRRNLIMERGNAPQEWTLMFGNIENNFAPWKFSPEERTSWTEKPIK